MGLHNNYHIYSFVLVCQFVDEGGHHGSKKDYYHQVKGALDAHVAALHLSGLLVCCFYMTFDIVALSWVICTKLIWLFIFYFWSPNSRIMLFVVYPDSFTTRFIILNRLVWSSASLLRSNILSRLLIVLYINLSIINILQLCLFCFFFHFDPLNIFSFKF